jgi:uncharacterized protein
MEGKPMTRDEVLAILRDMKPELVERYGVERVGIFGSLARGESGEASDVDVVVSMPPDLFAMVHLKEQLENAFQTQVDLVRYRKQMNAFLKERIEKEAVYA